MRAQSPWLHAVWPTSESIARRYDCLARFDQVLRPLFWDAPGLRRKVVEQLRLSPGDTVLEIGCGSGRNLRHLVAAVGPSGQVLGIDVSAGMLVRARQLAVRRAWSNVTLLWEDAAGCDMPAHLDAILFSFSYSVIPRPSAVLRRCWESLGAGGRLVIVDAGLPGNDPTRPTCLRTGWLRRSLVLVNPTSCPWEDLARLTPNVHTERVRPFGSYFTCSVTKGKPPFRLGVRQS